MERPRKSTFGTPLEGLGALVEKATATSTLAGLVRHELAEPLGGHVVSAARRGADLVVVIDSSAWAARIRYAGPRLKERLAAQGEAIEGKVRVRVRGGPRPTTVRP